MGASRFDGNHGHHARAGAAAVLAVLLLTATLLTTTSCSSAADRQERTAADPGDPPSEAPASSPSAIVSASPTSAPGTVEPEPTATADDIEETAETTDPPAADRRLRGTMSGTATVTATTYDYCGPGSAREQIGRRTYDLPATLELSDPKSSGGIVEDNPFHLALLAGGAGTAGNLMVASSLVTMSPGGEVLLTYWRITYDGENLSGELVDDHLSEAAAVNQFGETKMIVPCRPELGTLPFWPGPVADGATLRGSLTDASADLVLQGSTTGGVTDFQLHFVG